MSALVAKLFEPETLPSAEAARAWDAESLTQERVACLAVIGLAAVLVPVWILADYTLEPSWAQTFLAFRFADIALLLGAMLAIYRATGLWTVRAATSTALILTGVMIAFMLPRVVEYHSAYVLGFSLIFWGGASLLKWPAHHSLVCFGTILVSQVVLHLLSPSQMRMAAFVGDVLYIASAAIIGTIGVHVRRRVELRAFISSYELGQRNAELARAMESLRDTQNRLVESEKLSAIGRLLAGLSHEINNPLNVIHNNLPPLKMYLDDLGAVIDAAQDSPAAQAVSQSKDIGFMRQDFGEALRIMELATQRIRGIHEELRVFIRGGSPDVMVGSLNDGLRTTVAMLARGLPPTITIQAEYGELPTLAYQPGPMNQVFFNLLRNAIEAVGAEGAIVVHTSVVADRVRIAVTDSGAGVSEDARPKLFEPFFTTKPVGQGTGLGLAISYQIVQSNGGELYLDATWKEGARFVVELPLKPEKQLSHAA